MVAHNHDPIKIGLPWQSDSGILRRVASRRGKHLRHGSRRKLRSKNPSSKADDKTNKPDLLLADQFVLGKSGQFLQGDWLRGCAGRRASLLISCTARPEPPERITREAFFCPEWLLSIKGQRTGKHNETTCNPCDDGAVLRHRLR